MKNASEIKHSLSAVKQTRQITNAMYLLSVSEMKKCLGNANYASQYMQILRETKRELLAFSRGYDHPFKRSYSHSGRSAFIVIGSEKSMCGSYNSNIANLAEEKIKAANHTHVILKGSFAKNILAPKGITPDEEWTYPGNYPKIEYATDMANKLIELYLSDEIDEVYIIYTKYINQMKQVAKCYRLLPLDASFFNADDELSEDFSQMEFYPSKDDVFFTLARQFVEGFVYSAMYQSFVSEHVSRMNAMKTATNNADDMIKDLTHKYNSIRQVAITNELIEITAASQNTEEGKK